MNGLVDHFLCKPLVYIAGLIIMLGAMGTLSAAAVEKNPKGPATRASKPATPQPKKPEAPPTPGKLLRNAIGELAKEYQLSLRDPSAKRRDKCDYFLVKPIDGLTVPMVLGALESSQGNDLQSDSYIKWQLLSAIAGPIDDEFTRRAIRIYANLPTCPPRYGMAPRELNDLQRSIQRFHAANEVEAAQKQFQEAYNSQKIEFGELIHLRNELFTRLPRTFDKMICGLEDMRQRVEAGDDSTHGFIKLLDSEAASWVALSGASPREVGRFRSAVESTMDFRSRRYPRRVVWNTREKQIEIEMVSDDMNYRDRIKQLLATIDESANNNEKPAGNNR